MLEGYRKLPNSASFGVLFGRLVREKRGIEGLSQDGLAGRADLTKARISDLETGKIDNPHAATVDAICVALNISRDERSACYGGARTDLPPRLLENLALRFGCDHPNSSEAELEAFLCNKADEFRDMQARLAKIVSADGRVAELAAAAAQALGEGDIRVADQRLAEAEAVQLESTTLAALDRQCELRFARGHAALLDGDVATATAHWEAAANYFHYLDRDVEAERRFAYCDDLRAYGYRYRSAPALEAAIGALQANLAIWTKPAHLKNWCRATIALGGAYWRLSQFDDQVRYFEHIGAAIACDEAVRETCSDTTLPYYYAISGGNLASILLERKLADSDAAYLRNLERSVGLQLSALRALSKVDYPLEWGIFQHNIGLSYIRLFKLQLDPPSALDIIERAIDHIQSSFEVRDPENELQYWIASCRSLGEALIEKARCQTDVESADSLRLAQIVLTEAVSKAPEREHPHQWAELQEQLARCATV